MTKLRGIVQETVDNELQEIFGLFRKPKTPKATDTPVGPGSTEKINQDSRPTIPSEVFSLQTLKQQRTIREIQNYVSRTLQPFGKIGRGRAVYAIDDATILKVVLENDKLYQNKNEVANSQCIGLSYAVQVFEFHPRYIWIVEERVKPIESSSELTSKFNELTGLEGSDLQFDSSNDIQSFLQEMPKAAKGQADNPYSNTRHSHLMKHSPWYKGLVEKLAGCKVASWDFHKDNWGIRSKTGELVLLDLGFNEKTLSPEEQFFKETMEMVLQEEAMHHGFNTATLRTLRTLGEIQTYCYENLGNETMNGAARLTWVIDDSSVIKVVYRENGAVQNQQEIKNAECLGERYAVKILDYDKEHFYWVIEERVKGFPTAFVVPEFVEMMNNILGTEYDDWYPIMTLFFYGSDAEKDELMKNNEWFRGIVQALEHCDVASHDLHPGNWGVRPSTGELVILDLGF